MRSYMNLAVLALAASSVRHALSAPIPSGYGNLLIVFKGQAFLMSGIPLGALRWTPVTVISSKSLVSEFVSYLKKGISTQTLPHRLPSLPSPRSRTHTLRRPPGPHNPHPLLF